MTTQPKEIASQLSYDITLLMSQTRQLAANYRKETGHALPVTEELARFDAVSLLGLNKVEDIEGIDAVDYSTEETESTKESDSTRLQSYLIKGRVIFKGGKARQKLGRLSLNARWSCLLMVIYDADYQPSQIFSVSRKVIDQEMDKVTQDKRGSMTVAKYKAIGQLVWDAESNNKNSEQP